MDCVPPDYGRSAYHFSFLNLSFGVHVELMNIYLSLKLKLFETENTKLLKMGPILPRNLATFNSKELSL